MTGIDAPLIAMVGVRKSYGNQVVLHGIDLAVARSQVVTLIGRSGSGKSSLLRTLNGLAPIDTGTVRVREILLHPGEVPAATLRGLRREVGMVFQKFNLFPHLCALDNVSLALRTVQGLTRTVAEQRAQAMLERVGMADRARSHPHQLSGGQQQRVAIARALAMAPEVLLCDEITSALDPELTSEVLAVIRTLATEGMTILMATHEMDFAREVSDTLVFLQDGRIHESGPTSELFARPRTPELARFLGAMGPGAV
jgi:polar amino acid transport system ATP-binding protein